METISNILKLLFSFVSTFYCYLVLSSGGRRYTIQGLEMSTHRSAPDIRAQRPFMSRQESVPEDLMAVYRNMNREVKIIKRSHRV